MRVGKLPLVAALESKKYKSIAFFSLLLFSFKSVQILDIVCQPKRSQP
jgi:hypothetical protein